MSRLIFVILLFGLSTRMVSAQFFINNSPTISSHISMVSRSTSLTLDRTKKDWYTSFGVTYQFYAPELDYRDRIIPTNVKNRLGGSAFVGRSFQIADFPVKFVLGIQGYYRKGLFSYENDILHHIELLPGIMILKNQPAYSYFVQLGAGAYYDWGWYQPTFPNDPTRPLPPMAFVRPRSSPSLFLVKVGFSWHGKRGTNPPKYYEWE